MRTMVTSLCICNLRTALRIATCDLLSQACPHMLTRNLDIQSTLLMMNFAVCCLIIAAHASLALGELPAHVHLAPGSDPSTSITVSFAGKTGGLGTVTYSTVGPSDPAATVATALAEDNSFGNSAGLRVTYTARLTGWPVRLGIGTPSLSKVICRRGIISRPSRRRRRLDNRRLLSIGVILAAIMEDRR